MPQRGSEHQEKKSSSIRVHAGRVNIFLKRHDRDHSFSTYAKFSENPSFLTLWFLTPWVRNASFPENFAYILNE